MQRAQPERARQARAQRGRAQARFQAVRGDRSPVAALLQLVQAPWPPPLQPPRP